MYQDRNIVESTFMSYGKTLGESRDLYDENLDRMWMVHSVKPYDKNSNDPLAMLTIAVPKEVYFYFKDRSQYGIVTGNEIRVLGFLEELLIRYPKQEEVIELLRDSVDIHVSVDAKPNSYRFITLSNKLRS